MRPVAAHPYWYFVPYDDDVQRALDRLRRREFEAGRYNPVLVRMHFGDPALFDHTPGARHRTIAEALADAGDDGTRSILDVDRASGSPGVGIAAPLSDGALHELFDTRTPTRDAVEEQIAELLGDVERGQCVYVVVYDDGDYMRPSELFFAGFSL
jgi:hypothetical protein